MITVSEGRVRSAVRVRFLTQTRDRDLSTVRVRFLSRGGGGA